MSQVRRETPAFAAGFNVDDEILAIDEFRVRALTRAAGDREVHGRAP